MRKNEKAKHRVYSKTRMSMATLVFASMLLAAIALMGTPFAMSPSAIQEHSADFAIAQSRRLLAPEIAYAADATDAPLAAYDLEAQVSAKKPATKSKAKYKYKVKPLLGSMNGYLYVMTANPNPKSFRLVDKSSKYIDKKNANSESGVFALDDRKFIDVKYEKTSTRRVKGGYIFRSSNWDSDGGTLIVQKKAADGSFIDTAIKVKCPTLRNTNDYIIAKFANGKKGFFDKLDAIESAFYKYAVYPSGLYDKSKRSKDYPYPLLAASPYEELSLNEHISMYEGYSGSSLLMSAYPLILDSASWPGTIASIAKKLNPKCSVSGGEVHWQVNVKLNGKTKIYGWAGEGGNDPVYTSHFTKLFMFNGASSDFGLKGTLTRYCNKLLSIKRQATKDAKKYLDLVEGDTFEKKVKNGTWIRVGYEGWFGIHRGYFAYYASLFDGSTRLMSDAWVDGRYIDSHEVTRIGESFKDHPTSSIVKRNMTYTDIDGKVHTCDVIFNYDSATKTWRAPEYYRNSWWNNPDGDGDLPSEFILTAEQVKAMKVDANNSRPASSGLIYDGLAYPGTRFTTKMVTGLKVPKTVITYVNGSTKLKTTVSPKDATYDGVTWTSSNEKIATVSDGFVYGQKAGKATLTAKTLDGGYTATCTVTVKNPRSLAKATVKLSKKLCTYNGKERRPSVSVKLGGTVLKKDLDYTLEYRNNKYATSYASVTVRGINAYKDTAEATFVIGRAKNTMLAAPAKKVLKAKASALSNKSKRIKRSAAFKVTKAKGTLSFSKVSGNKRIAVNANGTVNLKKGLIKGTYRVKVKVRADGMQKIKERYMGQTYTWYNQNYKPAAKLVTLIIKVV